MMKTLLLLPLVALLPQLIQGQCVVGQFGYDSFVCVCNATYCDEPGILAPPATGTYALYTSSRDGARLEPSTGAVDTAPGAGASIDVSTAVMYQTMLGFGGAFTDSTGFNLKDLSPAAQDMAMRAYFAPEGIGYSVCRIPIAGSDCSTRPYSYDDVDGDVELLYWALAQEDYDLKFPYLKRAIELSSNEIFFFGSPWAPPAWMKSNGMFNGSGVLLPEMYQPYSEYIVKFVNAYEAEGVPIWGLTPQNEPMSGFEDWGWNTCGFTDVQMRDWIKNNLGPTLEAAGMRRLKMLVNDFNRGQLPDYVVAMLEDPDSNKYIDGIAVHWYDDDVLPPSILNDTHYVDPTKFMLYTEACEGWNVGGADSVQLGSWPRAENYFQNIIEDINYWSTGWVDWNMALGMDGGPNWANNMLDSPIIVNAATDEFYKQPTFYAMAHASKFIPRDSHRVETVSNAPGVEAAAVHEIRGTITLIIMNTNDATTSVSVNVDSSRYVNIDLPPKSFHSLVIAA